MAVQFKEIISAGYAPNATTTMFTSPAKTVTRIDAFTVSNVTATTATISIYLVPSGGSAGASNLIINTLAVPPGLPFLGQGVIGQALNAGDFIAVVAGTVSALVVAASGAQFT